MFRGILDNVLSGMKAGFKAILNLQQPCRKEKMFIHKSSSKLSATLLALVCMLVATLTFAADKVGRGGAKYGGTLNLAHPFNPEDFDQAYRSSHRAWALNVTNDLTIAADWAKGPNGTGKLPANVTIWPSEADWAGYLVESWDISDPLKWTLNVRKGVHFHNKPPVNGREMTAEDVAVSFHRSITMPGSWASRAANKPTSIKATDRYTVVVEFAKYNAEMSFILFNHFFVVPKEVVWDKDGNETEALRDWKNSVGTGPFILTDYVEGAHLDYVKFDNYWKTDPIPGREGNKLPYVDGMRIRIIEESATRVAALRAGKLDATSQGSTDPWVTWSDAEQLKKSNPELKWKEVKAFSHQMALNTADSPLSDFRVRRALSMAIDRKALVRDLYNGNGDFFNWFMAPKQQPDLHTPLERLPAELQELINYNPEKAKALLAEAGYPKGFEMKILVKADNEDRALFIRNNLKKIGVTLNIDTREAAVFSDLYYSKKYKGASMWYYSGGFSLSTLQIKTTGFYGNFNNSNDPFHDAEYLRIVSIIDPEERNEAIKKHSNYVLGLMWGIPIPSANFFTFWQPWLKGFEGAYYPHQYGYYTPFAYTWIDKE